MLRKNEEIMILTGFIGLLLFGGLWVVNHFSDREEKRIAFLEKFNAIQASNQILIRELKERSLELRGYVAYNAGDLQEFIKRVEK